MTNDELRKELLEMEYKEYFIGEEEDEKTLLHHFIVKKVEICDKFKCIRLYGYGDGVELDTSFVIDLLEKKFIKDDCGMYYLS